MEGKVETLRDPYYTDEGVAVMSFAVALCLAVSRSFRSVVADAVAVVAAAVALAIDNGF